MKPADYFYLLLAPVLLSAGQVLFKKTADAAVTHSLSRFLGSLLASPHFWTALFIYGAATLLWVFDRFTQIDLHPDRVGNIAMAPRSRI